MTHVLLRHALAFLLLAAPAGAAGYQEDSLANFGSWQRAAFWCDTPERVLAVSAAAGSQGPVTLAQWEKGRRSLQAWQLGRPDPGAGQVYTPLIPAGQPQGHSLRYFIHSSNIENTADPQYRMTHVNEFVVPAGRFQCRYVPQATVLAATAKHTVIVWEARGRVTYASRNRDGTPGVQLAGGTHTRAAGRERYAWQANGYTYVLQVGNPRHADPPGGSLSVLRGGRVLSREELLAYSLSTPR